MLVADVAVDLGAGHQGRHRVDDHHVNAAAADEDLGYLQRLLAEVGLGDEQVVHVHPEAFGVGGVQRVFGVDEGDVAAPALGLGDDVQGQGGLARGLRAVDLRDPAARQAADAQGQVYGENAGGDDRDVLALVRTQPHDRPLAELPMDLGDRVVDAFQPPFADFIGHCHGFLLVMTHYPASTARRTVSRAMCVVFSCTCRRVPEKRNR